MQLSAVNPIYTLDDVFEDVKKEDRRNPKKQIFKTRNVWREMLHVTQHIYMKIYRTFSIKFYLSSTLKLPRLYCFRMCISVVMRYGESDAEKAKVPYQMICVCELWVKPRELCYELLLVWYFSWQPTGIGNGSWTLSRSLRARTQINLSRLQLRRLHRVIQWGRLSKTKLKVSLWPHFYRQLFIVKSSTLYDREWTHHLKN